MDLSPLSYANYSTYRIPDGDVVEVPPPPPTGPPVTRRQLVAWGICFATLAAGPIITVIRALWP